jgi:hypothetical protein
MSTTAVGGVVFPTAGRGTPADQPISANSFRDDTMAEGGDPEILAALKENGYESEADFLEYWIREYQEDAEYDKDNREEAMEDLRFTYVDQWDETTRREREEQGRPCITVNTLPQIIGQVVGDRRINSTSIKVVPTSKAFTKVAEVRSGLIKSIENFSRADTVYDACCEDQVACGISNFEVTMEYSKNDVFVQDIFIRQLHNPFSVTWDRQSRDPTGRDARHCFVEDDIPVKDFMDEYGMEDIPDSFPTAIEGAIYNDWNDGKTVKLCAVWIMVDRPAIFALMSDGDVEDITDMEPEEYADRLYIDAATGQPLIREGVRTYAQRWLITGFKVLEGPYEIPLSRLPVIRVVGRVGRVGNRMYRFGIVRWARDPSLLRNYWRSITAETLAMAPKAVWIADHNSVKGREEDFREAHLTGDPLLIYNSGKMKPERVDPPAIPQAVLTEANMNAQDIKDVTGIHDASLGIRSNEVSGKAIMARQREGDVATVTFHDHLNLAIQEAGDVCNQLIPLAYDTTRTIRVIGPEDEVDFVNINDPADEESPNIVAGKYDVQLITGPNYTTQRMEAADSMLEALKTMPEPMSQALDLIVEAQDWPGAQRIAKRFRKMIPAAQEEEAEREGTQGQNQPAQPSPEEQMAMAQMQMQMEAMQAEHAANMEMLNAKVAQAKADAEKALAEAEKAITEAQRERALLRKAIADAEKAEAEAEIKDDEAEFHRHSRIRDMSDRDNPPESRRPSPSSGGGSRSADGS